MYSNDSDDNVARYDYDAVYDNKYSLEETEGIFLHFIRGWCEENAFEL